MTENVDKTRIMELLRRAGLWAEAERHREEVRQRLRAEGRPKREAVAAAWDAMAEKYLPLVEQSQPSFQTILPQGAKCFDDLVDTVVDYNRAKTPPPTGLACVILETWAAKPRDKRDGLFREIRIWLATGKLEPEPEPPMAEGGFLDEIRDL